MRKHWASGLRSRRLLTPFGVAMNGLTAIALAGIVVCLLAAAVEVRLTGEPRVSWPTLILGFASMAGFFASVIVATADEDRERTGWWWHDSERLG